MPLQGSPLQGYYYLCEFKCMGYNIGYKVGYNIGYKVGYNIE